MNKINECVVGGGQHCWVTIPKGRGLQCYSCPMCGQLVYWSDVIKTWIKPSTSGDKPIRGNA